MSTWGAEGARLLLTAAVTAALALGCARSAVDPAAPVAAPQRGDAPAPLGEHWVCEYRIRIQPESGRRTSLNARLKRRGDERSLDLYGPMGYSAFSISEAADGAVHVSTAKGRWRTDNLPPELARALEEVRGNLASEARLSGRTPAPAPGFPLRPLPQLRQIEAWLRPGAAQAAPAEPSERTGPAPWRVEYPEPARSPHGDPLRVRAVHERVSLDIVHRRCRPA
ncbi:MAG: hypothetical protein ISN29_07570 [Gammaproteobacteria bacterium AqS3]|nr:hypothetical protein [Gammaproteobacteria bacterium AqS3]